jgi:hypothetical protein
MAKFYQNKTFDIIHVNNTVYNLRPYLYFTVRDKDGGVHVPGAEVKIVADIWVCIGTGKSGGWNSKKLETKYLPRCQVNLEEGTFHRKDGTEVIIANGAEVIQAIQTRVFDSEEV